MRFILPLFCLLASLAARAQVDSVAQSAPRKPLPMFGDKNLSLGLNTQFLFEGIFEGEISTPFEILVRKRVGKSGAIRLRTWGLVQTSNRTQPYGNTFERVTDLGIAAGKEWHRAINHKWGYYYGAELGIGFQYNRQDSAAAPFLSNGITLLVNREVNENSTQVSLNGVLGTNYMLSKRFTISGEIGLGIAYTRIDWRKDTFTWLLNDPEFFFALGPFSHNLTSTFKFHHLFIPKISLNLIL